MFLFLFYGKPERTDAAAEFVVFAVGKCSQLGALQMQFSFLIKKGGIHFHTNKPWEVLEYCATLGEIHDIVVENMQLQSEGMHG